MFKYVLSVALAASVAHPFIIDLYQGPIARWLAPRPTMLSLGEVIFARLVCWGRAHDPRCSREPADLALQTLDG